MGVDAAARQSELRRDLGAARGDRRRRVQDARVARHRVHGEHLERRVAPLQVVLQPAQRDALPEQEELEARAGALELGRLARRHVAVVLRALVPQELHLGRGPREVAAVVSHGRGGAGPGPRVPDRGRDRAAEALALEPPRQVDDGPALHGPRRRGVLPQVGAPPQDRRRDALRRVVRRRF